MRKSDFFSNRFSNSYVILHNPDDRNLDTSFTRTIVVVDGDDLLPGAQPQFSRADGQGDGRAQQGGLDMAVAVAVMPDRRAS